MSDAATDTSNDATTTDDATTGDDAPPAPVAFRVTGGSPTAEELAALTLVVTALGGGDEEPARARRARWSDPRRSLNEGAHLGWGR